MPKTKVIEALAGQLLLATAAMEDSVLAQALLWVASCTPDKGASAVLLTRPLPMTINEVLEQAKIEVDGIELPDKHLMLGGPHDLQRASIVFESTLISGEGACLSALNQTTLAIMAAGGFSERCDVFLGQFTWGPGELEQALAEQQWVVLPYQSALVFDVPPKDRYLEALACVGGTLGMPVTEGLA